MCSYHNHANDKSLIAFTRQHVQSAVDISNLEFYLEFHLLSGKVGGYCRKLQEETRSVEKICFVARV